MTIVMPRLLLGRVRRLPLLMYGMLLLMVGLAMYVVGVLIGVPRALFGLDSCCCP